MNIEIIYEKLISYGASLLLALLFLIVGLKIIKMLVNTISKRFEKIEIDQALKPFLVSIVKVSLQILLVISIASMIGIEMTSFIAVIGAGAFAVGLALQGSLANFAGGVLILLLKPFKVGDYIEVVGYSGTVKEIQIFHTILNTPDNKRVIIPNANLSNSSTLNYSSNPTRRVDFTFGVGYQDDIKKVKMVLRKIAENNPLVLKDPPVQIVLGEHGDNAVIFYMRLWCEKDDYWSIYFDILEAAKHEFDKEGINIPYPQMDIHMSK
ncbi:MAG: mechanosensitive ion channel protein MscS [Desulfitibacter sp. BRH_c19]|nr:MAG: mechanosensitive ion channel protein MscS [Desulfitibacter sp. BRH_c19]